MFKWKEEFSVNVEEIDLQHKKLFEIGAEVYEIASSDGSIDYYDEIMAVLEKLKKYTEYHFKYEEDLMRSSNYDQYDMHHFQHYFFIKKLDKLFNIDIDSYQNEVASDTVAFLADWIEEHIVKYDMQYKDLFNSLGIK